MLVSSMYECICELKRYTYQCHIETYTSICYQAQPHTLYKYIESVFYSAIHTCYTYANENFVFFLTRTSVLHIAFLKDLYCFKIDRHFKFTSMLAYLLYSTQYKLLLVKMEESVASCMYICSSYRPRLYHLGPGTSADDAITNSTLAFVYF